MSKVLITGGKGYLGKRLCDALKSHYEIIVASRSDKKIPELPDVRVIVPKDSIEELAQQVKGVDYVIHLAALDARTSQSSQVEAIDVNVTGTLNWLLASELAGVKRFLYFSTVHVYGGLTSKEIDERSLPFPVHPYSITHKAAEDYTLWMGYKGNLKTCVFRLSNGMGYPIGEMGQWHLLVPDLCTMAVRDQELVIKSNPNTARDFVTIFDVCRAVEYFFMSVREDNFEGVYNICSGQQTTLLSMAEMIQQVASEQFGIAAKLVYENTDIVPSVSLVKNDKVRSTGFSFTNDYLSEIKGILEQAKLKLSL